MKTIIPAAGRGSRMMPLTEDKPKHLIKVRSQPILTHVLESVYRYSQEYIIVIGYKGDMIKDEYGNRYKDTPIRYVEQEMRTGLANAIHQTKKYIDSTFLVILGDNIIQCDFESMINTHMRNDADATLLVEEMNNLDEASRYGVCEINNGEIKRIIEKPDNPPSLIVSTGFYIFKPQIFDSYKNISLSDRGEYEVTDLINDFIRKGFTVKPYQLHGWRIDLGYPEDIERAENKL